MGKNKPKKQRPPPPPATAVTTRESPSNEPEDLMDVIVYGEARVGDDMDEMKASSVATITQLARSLDIDMGESRIACGNDLGIGLLKAYHTLSEKSSLYEDKISDLGRKFAESLSVIASLKTQNQRLFQISHGIRSRFISVYKRDFLGDYHAGPGDIIGKGNRDAHDGNAVLDALLYQNGIRNDVHIFKDIYGVEWDYVLKIRT
jgi:hypothetical protein